MGLALPPLLIILAIVGVITAVGFGIAKVVSGAMSKTHQR